MHGILRLSCVAFTVVMTVPAPLVPQTPTPSLVLENVRIIDGTGAAPIENGRVVITGDRITHVGPAVAAPAPPGAERINLAGRTVIPGLIDLHFHIENDPRLALRQLSHGVTAFRDPGQWNVKFDELRRMIAADGLPGPRIFTTGPHIDGEHPAYPADSVVARDREEARRQAEISVQQGASALKIYFRLPVASAKAVIDVCQARRIPCTAHLELLDAGELIAAGLHGVEHITSFGVSVLPRREAEAYRQAVLSDNDARREGRMDPDRFRQLDGLLQSALQLSPDQREVFLRGLSASDPALERELRSLLLLEQPAGNFLERPAITVAGYRTESLASAPNQSRATGRPSGYSMGLFVGEDGHGIKFIGHDGVGCGFKGQANRGTQVDPSLSNPSEAAIEADRDLRGDSELTARPGTASPSTPGFARR